jgi:hypothetical protein
MPQRICRPIVAQSRPVSIRLRSQSQIAGAYGAATVRAVWREPSAQIRLHCHEPSRRRFAVPRLYFDQARFEIDLRPIKPLKLGASQTCKRTNGPKGQRLCAGGFK